jgi:hypothetical protein
MSGLERWYRRLLLAYPRRYRRTRGLELLTTLLDASGPEQRRPHWRDAVDVVATGLRYRFALPGGRWLATAVVFVALATGALGAGLGARLGWRGAPDLPTDDALSASAERFTPGWQAGAPDPDDIRPFRIIGNWLSSAPVRMLGGDTWRDTTGMVISPAATPSTAALAQALDRLHAAGWRTDPTREVGEHTVVTAHRAGIIMVVAVQSARGERSVFYFVYQREEPRPVLPLTIAGALLSGALGWLGAAALLRRARGRARGVQALLVAVAIPALGLLVPATATTWLILASGHPIDPAAWPPPPAWAAYVTELGRMFTVAGAFLALLVVLMAAVAPTARTYSPGRAP